MSPFRVSAIGSCRIHTPLREMAARHWFDFNNRRSFGFTHTTREALQQAEFLFEQYAPPPELIPFVCPTKNYDALSAKKHPKSDLYVVEICSGKEFNYAGHSVQLNYMKVHFKQLFKDVPWSVKFWTAVKSNDHAERRALLTGNALFADMSDFDREFLLGVQLESVTREGVWNDLAVLKEMLGEILLVTHFDARAQNGERLPDRSALIKLTHEAGAAFGMPVYDPTPLMESAGQERALDDEGRDLTHYAEDFTAIVGQQMFDLHIGARMEMHREGEDNRIADIGEPMTHLAPDFWSDVADAMKRHEFRYAEAALKDRLSVFPGDGLASAGLGLALHKSDRKSEALEPFQTAMAAGPMRVDHAVVAMKNFYHNKRYADAAALARGLLAVDTDNVDAHYTLGRLANRVNNARTALDHWLMLASIVPKEVEPHLQLMRIQERLGDDEAAIKRANKVLELVPTHLEALQMRSKLAMKRGDQTAALEMATALAAEEPETSLALMEEIVLTGKVDRGAEFAEAILNAMPEAVQPNRHEIAERAAQAAFEFESHEDEIRARRLYRVALRVAPESKAAERARKRLIRDRVKEIQPLTDRQAWTELVLLARGILSDDPAATKASVHGGRAYLAIGEAEKAFRMLAAATAYAPEDGWLWLNVARAAMKTDRFAEADYAYTQVEAFAPADKPRMLEEAQTKRAELSKKALEQGKRAIADEAFERALECVQVLRRSGEQVVADVIAEKADRGLKKQLNDLYKAEDFDVALKRAERVLAIDAESTVARVIAGKVLSKIKRYGEAVQHWQTMAALEPNDVSHWLQLAKCHKNLKTWDQCAEAAAAALRLEPDNEVAASLYDRSQAALQKAA